MSLKKSNQFSKQEPFLIQKFLGRDMRITIEYIGSELQTRLIDLLGGEEWVRTADIVEIIQTEHPQYSRSSIKKSLDKLERRGFLQKKKISDRKHNPSLQNYWRCPV